jgi:hypothetical protein
MLSLFGHVERMSFEDLREHGSHAAILAVVVAWQADHIDPDGGNALKVSSSAVPRSPAKAMKGSSVSLLRFTETLDLCVALGVHLVTL